MEPPACFQAVPWLEPLDAFQRLDRTHEALLLDGAGAHPEARAAYLFVRPVAKLMVRGARLEVTWQDGRREEHDAPLAALRRFIARYLPGDAGRFHGGLVGFFAYEAGRLWEPTLPEPPAERGPDMELWLCTDGIRFDRNRREAEVFATDLPHLLGPGPAAPARVAGLVSDLAAGPAVPGELEQDKPHEPVWDTSMDEEAFTAAVDHVRALIHEGDLFQANIATRFSAPATVEPVTAFAALQETNPSPFMALLPMTGQTIVSGSPEQLFAVAGNVLRSRPIAGTRPRGADAAEDDALEADLRSDPKERAEHTMLVDLVRNDVARVCEPGSVHVPELMSVERYSHVMHLVSRVEGKVRAGTDLVDWMGALFPGGTITGAPKHRAGIRIREAENVARGPYTGSAGFLGFDGTSHWNILIRTLVFQDGRVHIHAGSGIVADSHPEREWHEAQAKARAFLEVVGGRRSKADRVGTVRENGAWRPAEPNRCIAGRRVLVVDNYDSFVHNLADHCATLGADVRVVRNDEDLLAALDTADGWHPTHVILSPGPGRPEDVACQGLLDLVHDTPVLGVCLGHQILGHDAGARIAQVPPVHGQADQVHHDGRGLLRGLPSPLRAGRYHSLVVAEAPEEFEVTARLADGTIMAMQHRRRPWHGLQFHPESICTDAGLELLLAFLEGP